MMINAHIPSARVIYNLEKAPLTTNRQEPDTSDQIDKVVSWSYRISFSLLVLLFLSMTGTVAFAVSKFITLYYNQIDGLV